MATRSTKRKRAQLDTDEPSNPPQQASDLFPTKEQGGPNGFPFVREEVDWKYERLHLLDKTHKMILEGYGSMAEDVNVVLRSLPTEKAYIVRKSVMGEYTRLTDFTTRSDKMLHYMMCNQVFPEPDFDPTSLFFKIGETVLRLVSGLKFTPANFNPHATHELPPNSVYERLFEANEETKTANVRTTYINKEFVVNKKKVHASKDNMVKLSKLLLAYGFVMDYDRTKKKIPQWVWVLLEDDKEWEAFPQGSVSFQYLIKDVKSVTKLMKGKKLNYTLNGNTIAFSAWIFEGVLHLEKKVVHNQKDKENIRFM